METRERLISELWIIITAGFFSITVTTLLASIVFNLYKTFTVRFEKKVSKDVERDSLESWETKDS